MSTFEAAIERDMILFIGSYSEFQRGALADVSKKLGKQMRPFVLTNIALPNPEKKVIDDSKATVVECDFSSPIKIEEALADYKNRFLAVTCISEKFIPLMRKIIPHVPHLTAPTEQSLEWTTDKIKMRQLLRSYDKNISPKFMVVHDDTDDTLSRIEKRVGFPLIIKPAGLAASLLVTISYHREELEANLKNTVRKIKAIYKKKYGRGEPQILVEEYMEGSMYSIDSYVNQRGTVYHAPLVHVRTGRSIGFDDFFGYARLTPVKLLPHRADKARQTAEKAVQALNLRSMTCHIELIRTEQGWRVIEIGPRPGGFRHEMYKHSYGINHFANDILIRIPKRPHLTKKAKGYTSVLRFYPPKKGRLAKLEGIKKIRDLESFFGINIKKQIGDLCDFARNGDDPIFDIVMFNKERSKLFADVRRLEKTVKIFIKQPKEIPKLTGSK